MLKFFILMLFSSYAFAEDLTLTAWKKLSLEEKVNHLDTSSTHMLNYVNGEYLFVSPRDISADKKKAILEFIPRLKKYPTELYTDIESWPYGLIGGVTEKLDFLFSTEGILLGALQSFRQQGCSHQDEDGEFVERDGYYENEQEAAKMNCHDNDVSWSGESYRDASGREFDHSEYMEWTGH